MPKGVEHSVERWQGDATLARFHHRCRKALSTLE